MFETELITRRAELAALESEWNALADRNGDPCLRHDWFMTAAEVFAQDGDLRVTVARDASGLRAAVPLVRDRGRWSRQRLLGHQLMEPQALLHDDREALEAACKAALASGLPLSLPRLAADSVDLETLAQAAAGRGVRVIRTATTRTHANPLGGDWTAFEKAMPRRKAADIHRRRKRLAEAYGEVAFEALSPSEGEAAAALEDLRRVEAAGWKARAGTAMLQDEAMGRFVTDYARRAARAGRLRVFNLRVAGEVVAAHMMIESGARLWAIKMGADERFQSYGVGVMATHEVLRWACERKLDAFEHLGVAEGWQARWPHLAHEQTTFHFYPRSAKGAGALAADTLAFAGRRLRKRRAAKRIAPAERAPIGDRAKPAAVEKAA